MTRRATRLLLLVLTLLTVLPAIPARGDVGTAVTWTVDHRRQTITVVARIQIFLGPCTAWPLGGGAEGGPASYGPGRTGHDCSATDRQIAAEIQRDIESVWNGHTYRCYRLIVRADVSVTTDRFNVGPNRIGVHIDRSVVGIRSGVQGTIESKRRFVTSDRWQSNDPADRWNVDNWIIAPTDWAYPPTHAHLYAHEFGHLLGLDDTYVEGSWVTKPGAPNDVMSSGRVAFIDQTTIDRVVERNRDRLVDRQGRQVALEDLVCDRRFEATLTATEVDYDASHLTHELTGPGCDPPHIFTETRSTEQLLDVRSQPLRVNVVEDAEAGPPGYGLGPMVDVLRTLWGLTGQYLDMQSIRALDLPVTVTVDRHHQSPANGVIPPVAVLEGEACSEAENGESQPTDCGRRRFDTWVAIIQRGGPQVVMGSSQIPLFLSSIGRSSQRLDALYRNCPGPTPWPGAFADEGGATVEPGTLPPLDDITKVARDWYHDHIPGRIVIRGSARLEDEEPGFLRYRSLSWTLTLCPVDRDGATPPGCP